MCVSAGHANGILYGPRSPHYEKEGQLTVCYNYSLKDAVYIVNISRVFIYLL